MAAAPVIRYRKDGDRFWRIGRDMGTDGTSLTLGTNVADAVVEYVTVPPASISSPGSPHVVVTVYEGAPGESFDPAAKCAAFHNGADAQRIRANATGPNAWSFRYVLQEAAARVI